MTTLLQAKIVPRKSPETRLCCLLYELCQHIVCVFTVACTVSSLVWAVL